MGTGSIRSVKDGGIYRVTGMLSFGSIKMGDASGSIKDGGKVLLPGEIGVGDYIREVKRNNADVPNANAIISNIEEELKNIAGTINRAIGLIESDQRVQYCVNGRDLKQITGGKRDATEARFPNLLNQYRVVIGMAALRKAQDNYNKKVATAIEEASKDSSLDVAQYLCQKMADMGTNVSGGNELQTPKALTPPFAISYDVGAGLDTKDLLSASTQGSSMVGDISNKNKGGGVLTERTAVFTRETRNCHICTTKTTSSCKSWAKWSGQSKNKECKLETSEPYCEDVHM